MGIDGISGGGMQGLQRAQGTPDLRQLQETGAKLDQEIKQLAELIKSAMASGANPEALKALMAQLAQLQQVADATQGQGGIDAQGGGQQGGGGAAPLDVARKLDDLKKQLEAIAQSGGIEAGAIQAQQQQAQLQQQMQPGAMERDRNMVQTPNRLGMY
ncbi:MAG TPA: hypothetical protein V6D00_10230 [Pantanalinema sp.]